VNSTSKQRKSTSPMVTSVLGACADTDDSNPSTRAADTGSS
jgi:hypothetical protein